MIDFHVNMFGSKSKLTVLSPLEKGDHPDLDTSECLDQDGIQKHQSLVGIIQWAAPLCMLDASVEVMTLVSF